MHRVQVQLAFRTGMFTAAGIILLLGFFLFARAVPPGAVWNPTFEPTDDDVQAKYLRGPVMIVENPGSAVCPAGYKAIGGACHSDGFRSYFYTMQVRSDLSGWDCNAAVSGSLIAQVICAKAP